MHAGDVRGSNTELESRASSNLRASIAKLELLIYEATRLADLATEQEPAVELDRTKAPEEEAIKVHEWTSDGSKEASQEREVVSTGVTTSEPITVNKFKNSPRTISAVSSLPIAKSVIAAPVLTLSDPPSRNDAHQIGRSPSVPHSQNCYVTAKSREGDLEGNIGDQLPPCHDADTKEKSVEKINLRTSDEHEAEIISRPIMILVNNDRAPSQSSQSVPGLLSLTKSSPPICSTNTNDPIEHLAQDIPEPCKLHVSRPGHERHFTNVFGIPSRQVSISLNHPQPELESQYPTVDLRRKSYVDIYNKGESFDVHKTCHHATVARNWPDSRKRFTAVVACINSGCTALLLGIYAGEVPAIQYAIADFDHFTILGNVVMYFGMAFSTLIFWPLPLLHGRKPYTIAAQICALALQLPQGLAVAGFRDPDTALYRSVLLTARGLSGLVLGFADINIKSTLLDLFGASLQSRGTFSGPCAKFDVRKHGGGMGIWLGMLAWSTIGPVSIGFMIGASIINQGASVSWGFWISLLIIMVVLLLNIVAPEVRRSAFRRTISEISGTSGGFSRITRGEIKMHLDQVGPYWWGEELSAGLRLCGRMLLQPGFVILAIYMGWIYAQYSLVLMVSIYIVL